MQLSYNHLMRPFNKIEIRIVVCYTHVHDLTYFILFIQIEVIVKLSINDHNDP